MSQILAIVIDCLQPEGVVCVEGEIQGIAASVSDSIMPYRRPHREGLLEVHFTFRFLEQQCLEREEDKDRVFLLYRFRQAEDFFNLT